MSTYGPVRHRSGPPSVGATDGSRTATLTRPGPSRHRRTTETNAAFKTTELIAYVVASARC
jgi:hypothetical protein